MADGSSNLVVAKMMTYSCVIFTALSIITVVYFEGDRSGILTIDNFDEFRMINSLLVRIG